MSSKPLDDLFKIVLKVALLSPLFAAYGAYTIICAVIGVARGARRAELALRDELRCPNGHENPVNGRWRCGSCGATYTGWVGACSICGTGATWFPCSTCGVGVRLPWERR
jgi:hypothetical protein